MRAEQEFESQDSWLFILCLFLNVGCMDMDRNDMRKTDASAIAWLACDVTIYMEHGLGSKCSLLGRKLTTLTGGSHDLPVDNSWSLPGKLSMDPFRGLMLPYGHCRTLIQDTWLFCSCHSPARLWSRNFLLQASFFSITVRTLNHIKEPLLFINQMHYIVRDSQEYPAKTGWAQEGMLD